MQIIEKILCSNVGDFREIILKENNKIIPLSIDQKPDDPEEKKELKKMGEKFHNLRKIGKNPDFLGCGKKAKFILV